MKLSLEYCPAQTIYTDNAILKRGDCLMLILSLPTNIHQFTAFGLINNVIATIHARIQKEVDKKNINLKFNWDTSKIESNYLDYKNISTRFAVEVLEMLLKLKAEIEKKSNENLLGDLVIDINSILTTVRFLRSVSVLSDEQQKHYENVFAAKQDARIELSENRPHL